MHKNNAAFIEAFNASAFTRKSAAAAMKVSVSSIDGYLAPVDASVYRPVSDSVLQHFRLVCTVKLWADTGHDFASVPVVDIFPVGV